MERRGKDSVDEIFIQSVHCQTKFLVTFLFLWFEVASLLKDGAIGNDRAYF